MSRMPLRYSRPTRLSCSPGEAKSVLNARATARYSVSWTSVDLPEPETPLTTVSVPNGTRNVTFFRLCWRGAPPPQGGGGGPRGGGAGGGSPPGGGRGGWGGVAL